MNPSSPNRGGNQALGMLLVVLGVLFLLGQFVDFGNIIGNWGWPFFVIAPGVLLLVLALLGGPGAAAMAIPGSIVTAVGLILFSQNLTDRFESWAYAWGLIVAAAGAGRYLQGTLTHDAAAQRQGTQTALLGGGLFLAFGAFFELFIFNESQLARYLVPLALIAAGVYLVMRRRPEPPAPAQFLPKEPEPPAATQGRSEP